MENASKALLMAASVLIGVLMLTVIVGLYISFGDFARNHDYKVAQQKIQEFNVQFTKYEGRTDLTAQDIVTVTNLAKEWNQMAGYTSNSNNAIKVIVDNKNMLQYDASGEIKYTVNMNTFMEENSVYTLTKDYITFTCTRIQYEDDNINNRVTQIEFEKNQI